MITWTRRRFLTLYDMAERGLPLTSIAQRIGITAAEVDLVLWRTLGAQNVTNAIAILNSHGRGEAKNLAVAAP